MAEILDPILYRYPQLSLPVLEGMSRSEPYLDIVRKGRLPREIENPFHGSPRDEIHTEETPIGPVELIHLGYRGDFVRFVQVMVHRCEPVPVPDSMGAVTISGITNWRKIQAHRASWLAANPGGNWAAEFKRFTSEPANYRDALLLVSDGPYSAVPASALGLDEDSWLEQSLRLRSFHELTHMVSRSLWPENKQAIRDEITADCIGILAALGAYDPVLAGRLLGLQGEEYLPGGRLQNYIEGGLPDQALLDRVWRQIRRLAELWKTRSAEPFAFLRIIEEERIGWEDFP